MVQDSFAFAPQRCRQQQEHSARHRTCTGCAGPARLDHIASQPTACCSLRQALLHLTGCAWGRCAGRSEPAAPLAQHQNAAGLVGGGPCDGGPGSAPFQQCRVRRGPGKHTDRPFQSSGVASPPPWCGGRRRAGCAGRTAGSQQGAGAGGDTRHKLPALGAVSKHALQPATTPQACLPHLRERHHVKGGERLEYCRRKAGQALARRPANH